MPDPAHPPDRRRVQRVRLPQPLRATMNGTKVFLVDLSLRGLRVLHQDDIGQVGATGIVRTEWDAHRIELQCRIVRTVLHRATEYSSKRAQYHSGLSITSIDGTSALTRARVRRPCRSRSSRSRSSGSPP